MINKGEALCKLDGEWILLKEGQCLNCGGDIRPVGGLYRCTCPDGGEMVVLCPNCFSECYGSNVLLAEEGYVCDECGRERRPDEV